MKRAEHAILAFRHFLSMTPPPKEGEGQYILNIIGPYQDGKYFQSLQKIVQEHNLEAVVKFTGGISLEERYKIAPHKVFLFPSHKEGYGLVVLEGNVYGIPAIGYDVPGVRDSITHGVNGFIVPAHDYKAMGTKLFEVVSDEKKYKKLVESSYKHVQQHTTWEQNTEKFESIIKKILS